jgi:hypothetical protein
VSSVTDAIHKTLLVSQRRRSSVSAAVTVPIGIVAGFPGARSRKYPTGALDKPNLPNGFGLSGGKWTFRRVTPGALARMCVLPLLLGVASCISSPGTLALQPAFEVMTPAGVASVSIRESPAGMTDAEFTQLVMAGTKWAAPDSVIAGPVEPPFPSQRIVWHVNLSPERGMSRLVVNVFDGANPYAIEQDTVMNDAPTAVVTSAVESMSKRLLADVAARNNLPNQPGNQVPYYEASQTTLSR